MCVCGKEGEKEIRREATEVDTLQKTIRQSKENEYILAKSKLIITYKFEEDSVFIIGGI